MTAKGAGADRTNGQAAVIFDFDGTMADTLRVAIGIFERMTGRNDTISEKEINRLRGLGGLHVLRELRIHPWRVPMMMVRGRSLMRRSIDEIKLFPGIKQTITELAADGVQMYVISSNSPSNIKAFLERNAMDEYFIRVYGNVGLFSKARVLRRVMAGNRLNPACVTYVGDESRDVEAAKRAGIRVVAVGWGYNTPELLASHHPDVLVTSANELAKALINDRKE
jgi:phosphoglycolate phosphatase